MSDLAINFIQNIKEDNIKRCDLTFKPRSCISQHKNIICFEKQYQRLFFLSNLNSTSSLLWNKLLREVVDSLFLEVFNRHVDVALQGGI